MNSELKRGSRLIGNMTRRQLTNRLIIVLIVLALLAVIGVILYFVIKALIDKYGPTPAPTPVPTTPAPTTTTRGPEFNFANLFN
jgi:flagellar basal body-associated protein FliL